MDSKIYAGLVATASMVLLPICANADPEDTQLPQKQTIENPRPSRSVRTAESPPTAPRKVTKTPDEEGWSTFPLKYPSPVTRNDRITLIPKADGMVGAVVVRHNGIEMLLDKAYASVHIEGKGQVTRETYDAQKIAEEYGDVLQALPPRPAKFVVYFREGKDLLTDTSEQEIEKIIADLESRPAPDIQVIGHTDSAGGREFNDKLSLQRAERVRAVLTQRGIRESSVSVTGRGERELLVPTQDGVVEAGNRRVEVNVR